MRALSFIVSALLAASAFAQAPATVYTPAGRDVSVPMFMNATVTRVDTRSHTITFRSESRDVSLTVEGSAVARLGRLRAGDEVLLGYRLDHRTGRPVQVVTAILAGEELAQRGVVAATSPTAVPVLSRLSGRVIRTDAAAGTVTLVDAAGRVETLSVDRAAVGTLGTVLPGDQVEVSFVPGAPVGVTGLAGIFGTVSAIQPVAPTFVTGSVTSFDAATGALRLQTPFGASVFNVPPGRFDAATLRTGRDVRLDLTGRGTAATVTGVAALDAAATTTPAGVRTTVGTFTTPLTGSRTAAGTLTGTTPVAGGLTTSGTGTRAGTVTGGSVTNIGTTRGAIVTGAGVAPAAPAVGVVPGTTGVSAPTTTGTLAGVNTGRASGTVNVGPAVLAAPLQTTGNVGAMAGGPFNTTGLNGAVANAGVAAGAAGTADLGTAGTISGPGSPYSAVIPSLPSVVGQLNVVAPPQAAPALPEALPVGAARDVATRDYDNAVRTLALKANEIDAHWFRYRDGCLRTSAVTADIDRALFTSNRDREWFVLFEEEVRTPADDNCRQLRVEMSRMAHDWRDLMNRVEDTARKNDVLPGAMRESRQRYRVEF